MGRVTDVVDHAHDKYLWIITSNFSQSTGHHFLMMDPL